eukprot:TRINITY_DN4865_c2_g4_i1.p1 TRINITY_DN4865_c2_g4~~TRINITY_DN4865_c2_g4_i1.p1  ORF type:complete len:306 (+),score=43.77 TRINITY_DN4865_c2_g4_i1:71-988(+)
MSLTLYAGRASLEVPGNTTYSALYDLVAKELGLDPNCIELSHEGDILGRTDQCVKESVMQNGDQLEVGRTRRIEVAVEDLKERRGEIESIPEAVLVLDVASQICEQTLTLDIYDDVPDCVRKIVLVNSSGLLISSIARDFLRFLPNVVEVDFTILDGVKTIEQGFMVWCESLQSVDLSPLCLVKETPTGFFTNCTSLTTIDLSSMPALVTISDGFFTYCRNLYHINLTPLKSVASIGRNFLRGTRALSSVDLSAFTHVTSVGWYFLAGSGLRHVDVSPLTSVKFLGEGLFENSSLLVVPTIKIVE